MLEDEKLLPFGEPASGQVPCLVEGSVIIPYSNKEAHQVPSLKLTVKALKIGRSPKGKDHLSTPNHHCSGLCYF